MSVIAIGTDAVGVKHDVELFRFEKNQRLRVTKELCDNFKFEMVEAKNFLDALPQVAMSTDDQDQAKTLRKNCGYRGQ